MLACHEPEQCLPLLFHTNSYYSSNQCEEFLYYINFLGSLNLRIAIEMVTNMLSLVLQPLICPSFNYSLIADPKRRMSPTILAVNSVQAGKWHKYNKED